MNVQWTVAGTECLPDIGEDDRVLGNEVAVVEVVFAGGMSDT
jgi:hypothetical protein